jgi:hypothetical protein
MATAAARVLMLPPGLAGYQDDIFAVAGGVADAILLKQNALLFILKNIAVPVVDRTVTRLPKGLVLQSEGMLGFIATILLLG